MKKIILLATTLLFSVLSFAYEYVNDEYCIYKLDVGKQTAEVINFYKEASIVTIPATFEYMGDIYTVESISKSDFQSLHIDYIGGFDYSYYADDNSGYSNRRDYDKIRAGIVELNLPKTLKEIEYSAFSGMTRLKKITIPAGVKEFKEYYFSGNSRLETIILAGLPCCKYEYEYYKDHLIQSKSCRFCLNEVHDPIASLDSMVIAMRKSCPKLQTIEVLPLKDYALYKNKLDKSYATYSKRLKDTISIYEKKLAQHPYFISGNYFKQITLTQPIIKPTNAKENYTSISKKLKNEYDKNLTLCRAEYKKLWDNMEQNCKRTSPNTYADLYCKYNPEFSARIDSMFKDYKCDYTKQQLTLDVLRNYPLREKCQDKLWKQYSYLYKDKEAFLAAYDLSSDIRSEIANRLKIYDTLKNQIKSTPIAIKGFYDSDNSKHPSVTRNFRNNCHKMKEYGIPVSRQIISQDPKALKEFEKNGKYFADSDEFFTAYITANYKNILKAKKKASK